MALPSDLEWSLQNLLVGDLVLDTRVNPRDPNIAWSKRQLGEGYSRALIGTLIVSERVAEDGTVSYALLDGANRKTLIEMAGDHEHPVQCQVFHGLALELEAQVALEFNDKRLWTGLRSFQTRCTMGEEVAVRLRDALAKGGWQVDTVSGEGVIRGVKPFEKLILSAGLLAAYESKVSKGTERWNAAMESGKEDAFRVLEMAIDVYNAAFDGKPGGQAPEIMYAIGLLLLKYRDAVDPARLTNNLRLESKSQRAFRKDAGGIKDTMKLPTMVDAFAFLMVLYYNTGLKSNAKAALPSWAKLAR